MRGTIRGMRYLDQASEDEMVAAFLQAEACSPRDQAVLEAELGAAHLPHTIIAAPDLSSAVERRIRRQLLARYRGYGQDAGLFQGFPPSIRWIRAMLDREELSLVRYIDYEYWRELSGGSRLPGDAARRVFAGVEVFGVSNAPFHTVAARLARGEDLPAMILVSATGQDDFVVLEGHLRLTAFHLVPKEQRAAEMPVLLGISRQLVECSLY